MKIKIILAVLGLLWLVGCQKQSFPLPPVATPEEALKSGEVETPLPKKEPPPLWEVKSYHEKNFELIHGDTKYIVHPIDGASNLFSNIGMVLFNCDKLDDFLKGSVNCAMLAPDTDLLAVYTITFPLKKRSNGLFGVIQYYRIISIEPVGGGLA